MTELCDRLYPWHRQVWQRVLCAHDTGRLSHAYLIHGPDGVGKGRLAEALMGALICDHPDSIAGACGQCRSCRWFQADSHPDVIRLRPPDGKTQIPVDQIRMLGEELALSPHHGLRRTVAIVPADAMNVYAANSLLKTLEEPPAGCVLFLVTARPGNLPATIRSRCQKLAVTLPKLEEARQWLRHHHPDTDPAILRLALDLAGGAPLSASRMLHQDLAGIDGRIKTILMDIIKNISDPIDLAATFDDDQLDILCRWLDYAVRAVLRARHGLDVPEGAENLIGGLTEALSGTPDEDIFGYMRHVRSAGRQLASALNQRLLLEGLLIPWSERLRSGALQTV